MKIVLTIAGSDSSGGAGIQADLKTFEAFGVFGTSAITVLTAQNTTGVQSIIPLSVDFILQQIQSVMDDFEVSAIKIGMLYDTPIIEAITAFINTINIPVVLDPVCVSKAGSPLLKFDALDALRLLSREVSISTPNLNEAYELFGYKSGDTDSLKAIITHPAPILIKNHVMNTISADLLYFGHQKRVFTSEHIYSQNLHGTGCSYSSAITANLALGYTLEESIERSKRFITEAIRSAPSIGHGPGPINHKAGVEYLA